MNRVLSFAVVAIAAIVITSSRADTAVVNEGPKLTVGSNECTEEELEAILDTIAQINHINWVVNVIKTYDNAMILEEEYEKISYGNLNLNRIPDEETRRRITNMLDTLYSLRRDEREMKHWRGKFWDERMRKMREYDLKTAKRVWGLFREGILGFMTYDIGTVLQTAFDVGHGCLSLQYDYDNFVHSFDQEMQERVFAFDSQKMALLHKLNKEMLDDQWRLVQKYHLDDKATRVTDTDIKALLSVLKDGNASRIYTRLISMKSRYRLFPEFWYYLSCAAMETGHFKEGRDACDTFFKVNRGIFRDDPMAGTVALNKAMMLEKDNDNMSELRRCLEIAWEYNQNRNDWAQDFIVASLYDGILHDHEKAVNILMHAIASLEAEMNERKRLGKDIMTHWKTLDKYHAFLFKLLPNEQMPTVMQTSEFISFADKLRYLARTKETNVWEMIKDDVRTVSLDVSLGVETNDIMAATVPASWVLGEDVPVKLIVSKFGDTVTEIDENILERENNANQTISLKFARSVFRIEDLLMFVNDPFFEEVTLAQKQAALSPIMPMIDACHIKLVFDHPEFPVELTFALSIDNCTKDMGDDTSYPLFLFEFSALGKKYLWQPESGFNASTYSSDVTPRQRRDAFTSRYGFIPLDQKKINLNHQATNGIRPIRVKSGKEVSIKYRNVSETKFRPLVTLVFVNEYGMVISLVIDSYYDSYTKSHRTVPGFFSDDYYTDYNYQYMSPNDTRTFSTPKPANAKYLLMLVEARYNLMETKNGTL